ncbi:MAG: hypothetical protein RQ842_10605, partial [Vulcanisaeta sp.]|nr:hypothetical protein [Vulcanisaeta sp.]
MELVNQAMKCLENNNKECVMRKIEELIKANCHDGNAVGREIANHVRDAFHELWLISNHEEICRLLRMLRSLGVSKRWVRDALHTDARTLNTWFVRCGIDWENRMVRSNVVKVIEGLLRERFGWNEIKMCEELLRFIGVDVNAFRKYGIEPCSWLNGLEELSDLRRPYWLGLRASDLTTEKLDYEITLEISTTNSIDAVFFPVLLGTIKTPGLVIIWIKRPAAKYVSKSIGLFYYVDLGTDKWPWPIELSVDEFERMLNGFGNEELAEFIAGEVDGDGSVWYTEDGVVYVGISACKKCLKRPILDVLKRVITERFNIVGTIDHSQSNDTLVFGGEKAVKLLRLIRPFVHHPLRRLRIELILALYDGRISREVFEKLFEMTEYERGKDDIKRNRGLDALTRAAPQTHTHGDLSKHGPNGSEVPCTWSGVGAEV